MGATRLTIISLLICLLAIGAIGPAATAGSGQAMDAASVASHPATTTGDLVAECADEPPPDHADPDGDTSSVIGWVDGYWYTASLDIDGDDGLTADELERLTARTAARVEALRCLTFDELPPIEIIERDAFREDVETSLDQNMGEDERAFATAQLAAMFFVGQDEDAFDVLVEHRTGLPTAFYDTQEKYIGIITADASDIEIDQVTLAHELTHALQDEYYPLREVFREETNDAYMSSLAVIEGDAVYIDGQYEANCGEWVDECLRVSSTHEPSHWGLTLEAFAAYQTPLVADTYEHKGHDGVNQLFELYPDSMVEAMIPERYGSFKRADMDVPDQSEDHWDRLVHEEPAYEILGQHALTAMLLAPSYEHPGGPNAIDPDEFISPHAGGSFDYNHSVTAGWQNDHFFAYRNDAGDTAGVWKLAWEDRGAAERFADAYRELIAIRGGDTTETYANVYIFEDSDRFDQAVGIEVVDDRVWIVTAPSTSELSAVHADLKLEEANNTDREDRVAELETFHEEVKAVFDHHGIDDVEELNKTLSEQDDGLPGFGFLAGIAAVLFAVIVAMRDSPE